MIKVKSKTVYKFSFSLVEKNRSGDKVYKVLRILYGEFDEVDSKEIEWEELEENNFNY